MKIIVLVISLCVLFGYVYAKQTTPVSDPCGVRSGKLTVYYQSSKTGIIRYKQVDKSKWKSRSTKTKSEAKNAVKGGFGVPNWKPLDKCIKSLNTKK